MTPARTLAFLAAASLFCHGATAQEVVVTRPQVAPVEPVVTFASPPPAAVSATQEEPYPADAPQDEYEFVGWCAGVLTGHMALYEQVEPTLLQISKRWNSEERDAETNAAKQKAGRDILSQFADAMRAAEGASAAAIAPNGLRAIAKGRAKWAAVEGVDANTRAYSWMNWGLPRRCEATAAKLKSRATLMGAALRDNSATAIQTSAVRVVDARPDEPTPAKPAAVAPETVPAPAPAPAQPSAAAVAAAAILAPTAPPPVQSNAAPARAAPSAAPRPSPPRPAATPSQAAGLR